MKRSTHLLALVLLPALHGCGEPRADTASPATSFDSLRAMYAALPAGAPRRTALGSRGDGVG
ncbi:hypothetical protein [Dyella sp.]|uniref:hypothetical protein n=1 Tax=Dyella sp. TaxID=1869338 RepID=UPI003F7EAD87